MHWTGSGLDTRNLEQRRQGWYAVNDVRYAAQGYWTSLMMVAPLRDLGLMMVAPLRDLGVELPA